MQVTVEPPTQTAPSGSLVMRTCPFRPSTVPCRARYGARARPVASSHCASEALRLPVTGSSSMAPSFGENARTSNAAGPPGGAEVEVGHAGPDREHGVGAGQQHGDPAGSVVRPLQVDDFLTADPE